MNLQSKIFCKPSNFQKKIFSSSLKRSSSITNVTSTLIRSSENTYKTDFTINQYVINLDWFQVMLSGFDLSKQNNSYVNGDFKLIIYFNDYGRTGNQQFSSTYQVFYQEKLFGVLVVNPRSNKILKDETLGQFKADNEELYREGFIRRFQLFIRSFNLTLNNYSRVDIAMDFNYNPRFLQFMQSVQEGDTFQLLGNQKFLSVLSNNSNLIGFTLGGIKSAKKITCYDKSLEIKDKNHKPYIPEFWKRSGLISNAKLHHVTRLEIRMKRDELHKYVMKVDHEEGEILGKMGIGFFNRLPNFLKMVFKDFFEFGLKQEDTNRSRWPKIEIINFDGVKPPSLLSKQGRVPVKNKLKSYKLGMKKNLTMYMRTGNSDYLYILCDTAKVLGLEEFLSEKLKYWYADSQKEIELSFLPSLQSITERLVMINRYLGKMQHFKDRAENEFHQPSKKAYDAMMMEHSYNFFPEFPKSTASRYFPGFDRNLDYIDREQVPF